MGNVFTKNKKAYFDYFIEDEYVAGIILIGPEVKSIINSNVSISEAYIDIDKEGIVWLVGCHVDQYTQSRFLASEKYNPIRKRKLLLNKSEINKLQKKINEKGYTLIPLSIEYINKKIKVRLGLAKGKKKVDKRNALKEKQIDKDHNRENKYK